ncbi:MAG: ferrous iron transport protein B [Pseudomonadota bacterium]|nr:ferrous iron transport protein B [Pseudomonadota bacterium]
MPENKKLLPSHPPLSLVALAEGEEGVVVSFAGGRDLAGRLAGLGISLSAKIRMLRNSSGLIMVQVGETRIALGHGEAEKITVYRTATVAKPVPAPAPAKQILVALAGQPNVGKSTVFNILTGLTQHVGNWPGKTVEKKEGAYTCREGDLCIVDLPGTYSLTAFSEEERVARDFILEESPDVIVLLANAAALERSLYLLAELLLLGPPVLVAVNMLDVAEAQGIRIDVQALERALGVPVVGMVAKKNQGLRDLINRIISLAQGEEPYNPHRPEIAADHLHIYREIKGKLEEHLPDHPRHDWLATKFMEGDAEVSKRIAAAIPPEAWAHLQGILVQHEDSLHAVVGGRYDWIEAATRSAVSRFRMGQVVITDRLDHILTRPRYGIPILLAVFAGVFFVTYKVGYPMQKGLEWLMSDLAQRLDPLLDPFSPWIKGLVVDGVIGGAGSVLTFLPILAIFFAVLALLEDVGYMARAAFVMDRFMHLIGLHGKSVIPMCLGFGCNVPAVLGARIVESKRERRLTIFLSPFVPCTARLAVLTFVTAAVFASQAAVISWSLLAGNILLLGLTGMTINRFLSKDEPLPFIMELPLYHKPDPRTIAMVIWIRTIAFVKRAGTVILAVSVLVWALSYFPHGRVEDSLLAAFGHMIEPLGRPLGLDWKMMTALVTSIVAKENAVATLGVLYGVGDQGLMQVLPTVMTPASALSFLVVLMLFIPCAATVVVMKQEMEDWRWFGASFALMLGLSATLGFAAYRLALIIGL